MSGYAVIGIFLLVLTGSVIGGSALMDALDSYYNGIFESHQGEYERKSDYHHTNINITLVTYDVTGTTIVLNNTGSIHLDPEYLSLFIDSLYSTPIITNTNNWLLPGEGLKINFSKSMDYGNHTVKIVTENGKSAEANISASGIIYLKHDGADNRVDVLNSSSHLRLTVAGNVEDYDGGGRTNEGASIVQDDPYEWISETFQSNVRLTQDVTISLWVKGKIGSNNGLFNVTLIERNQFGQNTIIGYSSTNNVNWATSFVELNSTISISSYTIGRGNRLVVKGESMTDTLEMWVAYDVNDPVEGIYYPSKVEIT